MDHPVHDKASIIEEEDRISNLPDDIIHRILSFFDMKYAIQTSTLSKKWKHIWISMSVLNLNSQTFHTLPKFAKFVKHALSHRNHHTQVSAVELSFRGTPTQFVVKSIVKYAYSHNVRQLTLIWFRLSRKVVEFPQCVFSSHTLKHLTLATSGRCVPTYAWDFPALETLNLSNMQLGDHGDKSLNIFSKCVNLKYLTLHFCSMFALDVFNVCAPQLSDLTITYSRNFPKAFNIVAPQLKNLTATVNNVYGSFLQLCTEGLDSLEKVNLSLQYCYSEEEMDAPRLLDLFQKLRSAKFLILNMGVIKVLSKCLDQLSLEPCSFNNLKCLKIEAEPPYNIPKTIAQVRSYLLESSPSATFIMDIPQLPKKRSRQQVDKAKKVAKMDEEIQQRESMVEEKGELEAKIKMQDEVFAQQKAMLEAMKLHHEKLMSQMINWKIAELRVQVVGGSPDYELIRSIKLIMELTPESSREAMKAQFSCQYEEMKSLHLTCIDARQWEKIEMELSIITHSDNVHSQSDVPAVALP